MIYILIILIVVFGIDIFDIKYYGIKILLRDCCIGIVVGLFLWLILGGVIGTSLPYKYESSEEKLYSLDNNFLSICIDHGHVTYRYVVNSDKGKYINEIDSNNVCILEGNYEPIIIKYNVKLKRKRDYLFANSLFCDTYYEFQVPNGTVITDYNVNLENK